MQIDELLSHMRTLTTDPKAKGDAGEEACIAALKGYADNTHCVIIQSFRYQAATRRDGTPYGGNLKIENQQLRIENGVEDEIDIVLITDRRIFLIEVKSYGNAKLLITDEWFFRNGSAYEKDLYAQTEKHARLFYHTFYEYIPQGNPKYIVPMFVSVDKSTVINQSSDKIPAISLNKMNKVIGQFDKQLEWSIEIPTLLRAMKNKASSTFTER